MKRISIAAAAIAIVLVVPGAAFAAHGKAGLWEATATPDASSMPAIPPEVLAQMKAHGIKSPVGPGGGFTSQFCMTQAQVDADKPPPMKNNPCQMTSSKFAGQTYSADMVCSGAMQGTSHFTVTYDNPGHYTGRSEFNGSVGGQPVHNGIAFEGKWLQADCGDVKPFVPPK